MQSLLISQSSSALRKVPALNHGVFGSALILLLNIGLFAQPTNLPPSMACGISSSFKIHLGEKADLPPVTPKIGKQKALIFRIAFPDLPYAVDTLAINDSNAVVNRFYADVSRGVFQYNFVIHKEIWMAPKNSNYYDFSGGLTIIELTDFIEAKIKAAGYVKGKDFDVTVSHFPRIKQWDGTSYPWSSAVYINGKYDAAVIAHELGHQLGLSHADGVNAGTEVLGAPGNEAHHVEYGNPFDNMGFTPSFGHFHTQSKWRLGWMDAGVEVREITNSGVYRIFAHENSVHKGRLLGIRVPISKTSPYAYWIEYRTVNTEARTGALIHFEKYYTEAVGGYDFDGLHLLDMTPGTRADDVYHSDFKDAALVPGKTFKDKLAGLSFRTIAINTGVWNENGYVDVEITIPGTIPILAGDNRNSRIRPTLQKSRNILGRSLNNQFRKDQSIPKRKFTPGG